MMPGTIGTSMPAARARAEVEVVLVVEEELRDQEIDAGVHLAHEILQVRLGARGQRVGLGIAGAAEAEVVTRALDEVRQLVRVGEGARAAARSPAGRSPPRARMFSIPAASESCGPGSLRSGPASIRCSSGAPWVDADVALDRATISTVLRRVEPPAPQVTDTKSGFRRFSSHRAVEGFVARSVFGREELEGENRVRGGRVRRSAWEIVYHPGPLALSLGVRHLRRSGGFMSILVSGSLALDHIMVFPDRFKDHILPDKLHILNVSFNIESLGPISAASRATLPTTCGCSARTPLILATVGNDFGPYAGAPRSPAGDPPRRHPRGRRRCGLRRASSPRTSTTTRSGRSTWAPWPGARGAASPTSTSPSTSPSSPRTASRPWSSTRASSSAAAFPPTSTRATDCRSSTRTSCWS